MGNMIINGMDKNWEELIIVYGLTDDQINEVRANVPAKSSEVYKANCFTDIIAFPQMASVTVWSVLTDDDKKTFVDYFSEVAPFSETVILIGDVDIPKELKKHVLVYSSFDELASKMKYIFLGAHKKMKKNVNYSNSLHYALKILKFIRLKPYITTKELAEKTELSARSVQRYIETIRMAGEWIDYDTSHKGWVLEKGKSILCGDIFD